MNNDNYPLGAANDPAAPYNEPLLVEHKRFVSVSISFEVTIRAPKEASEKEIRTKICDDIHNNIIPKNYDIDELVILKD